MLHNGFEPWREVIEVKSLVEPAPVGQPFGYGKLVPVKGLGRISMILFAVVQTYNAKDQLLDDVWKDDFLRLRKGDSMSKQHRIPTLSI